MLFNMAEMLLTYGILSVNARRVPESEWSLFRSMINGSMVLVCVCRELFGGSFPKCF